MTRVLGLWTLGLALMFNGCAFVEPKESAYLRTAQNHATQDEVRQQLGPPRLTKPLEAGGSVWVYQFWAHEYGDRVKASGAWCDEYFLTFDSQAVLRRWDHQVHRHGGELMPTWCVIGTLSPAS